MNIRRISTIFSQKNAYKATSMHLYIWNPGQGSLWQTGTKNFVWVDIAQYITSPFQVQWLPYHCACNWLNARSCQHKCAHSHTFPWYTLIYHKSCCRNGVIGLSNGISVLSNGISVLFNSLFYGINFDANHQEMWDINQTIAHRAQYQGPLWSFRQSVPLEKFATVSPPTYTQLEAPRCSRCAPGGGNGTEQSASTLGDRGFLKKEKIPLKNRCFLYTQNDFAY